MSKNDYRKGAIPYQFVGLPKDVLNSPAYLALPPSAKELMLDLAVQYTGKNNGRLCPGFEVMQRRGWTSKHTLLRAKRALLRCQFVLQTRIGHPPRTAEWIGFTWWKLDAHPSMDFSVRGWPYLNFMPALSVVPKRHRYPLEIDPGGAKTAPMAIKAPSSSVQKQHHGHEVKAGNDRSAITAPVLEVAISGRCSQVSPPRSLQPSGPPCHRHRIPGRQTLFGQFLGARVRILTTGAVREHYELARERLAA
jgi:hypothetical protein